MRAAQFKEIFHPSDFTRGDEPAFAHALKIALCAKADLSLLHVKAEGEDLHWSDFPSVRGMLRSWGLIGEDASREDVARLGLRVMKVQRTGDNPEAEIEEYVSTHQPDLVVLATHQRRGMERLWHRSLAEPVARQSGTMTLFVPRRVTGFIDASAGRVNLKVILVPVDRAPNPQAAVDAAAALARALEQKQVHFILLYAGAEEDMPEVKVPLGPDWTSERRTWPGSVVDHILDAAEADEADLVVMATQGHDGFLDALRGSTTERVLRGVKCPLLAVPAGRNNNNSNF